MMTVHAAKGLEFDYVFVVGLEEDLFPHIRASEVDAEYEEERRLMYVALTRARRRLWLSNCESRTVHGRQEWQSPSSFFDEIPEDCVVQREAAEMAWRAKTPVSLGEGDAGEYAVDDYCQDQPELGVGLRVIHAVYGAGTVVAVHASGLGAKATVAFDKSGTRTLLLEYAGLQVLPGEGCS